MQLNPREEWRDVPHYEGCYQASSLGRIRSLSRTYEMRDGRRRSMTGRVLKACVGGGGYLIVRLSVGAVRRTRTVHTVVAETFLGPRAEGTEVCHGPGGQLDNSVGNLRYDTHAANQRDMINAGNHKELRKTVCIRGHALIAPNLTSEGQARARRVCRACISTYAWRRYRRKQGIATSDVEFRSHSDKKYAQIIAKPEAHNRHRQGMALSEDQVLAIKHELATNPQRGTSARLAREYGVSHCTIGAIKQRKTWSSV